MSNLSVTLLVLTLTAIFGVDPLAENNGVSGEPVIITFDDSGLDIPNAVVYEDTSKKKKNPNQRVGDATRQEYVSPLYLKNPNNYKIEFELDEDRWGYNIREKIGETDIRRSSYISFEDYIKYRREQGMSEYFREMAVTSEEEVRKGLIPTFDLGEISDIFGGGTISVRPTGYATLDFSIDRNITKNPALNIRQQRVTTFNFDQQIQLGVIGEIGNLMRLNANFDTQATFDFENELKLAYTGTEDQILQSVEAGNVSMQLGNSLMQGRQNLFGVKAELKFGPVRVTGIASTERGQVETVNVRGGGDGAVETPFEKEAIDYDLNRHFFLSHYFRSRYETAIATNFPLVTSNVRINRVEVWIERGGATRDTRNAIGFTDLGETNFSVTGPPPNNSREGGTLFNPPLIQDLGVSPFPDNDANDLYSQVTANPSVRELNSAALALEGLGFGNTLDFEIAGNMRKLQPNEFSVNSQLGYVSLNSPIPTDQVLFVAFEYSLNGQTFQVGEFSQDVNADGLNSNVLFLKLLKSSVLRPTTQSPATGSVIAYPPWDLMMKNIYNIGYGIKRDGFFMDIYYESGTSAGKINFLPDGTLKNKPLIQVMNVDKLTNHTAPGADFRFDFVEGITIVSDKGLLIFPVLEPFGGHLAKRLGNENDSANYVFQALYDDTPIGAAQLFPHLNRFTMEGYYQSTSSAGGGGGVREIPLNAFNINKESVTVTAGGRLLTPGVDYEVDEFGGKVRIINPALQNTNQDIQVNYESSSLYNIQTKTLLGARAEFSKSEDFTLGATILNLREQPFNQKTTLGDEPINNTLWGLDAGLRKESDLITKLVDKLPLISTKETSSINMAGEFAQFIPGQPRVVQNEQDRGIVFLDDFEAAKTPFSLQGFQRWSLASVPQGEDGDVLRGINRLPNGNDELSLGYTRAKLNWYQIDQGFYQGLIDTEEDDLLDNYTRRIDPNEIFPTARRAFGTNIQFTFDLRYQPAVRGPYNYQANPTRVNPNGTFALPEENWAGIMREIDINNDFEATNVEFLEFWMMDPFLDNPTSEGGDFYINLGLISEDILPDGALSRENALPEGGGASANLDTTAWAFTPLGANPVAAFSNNAGARQNQDVGFDGMSDAAEQSFFQDYLDQLVLAGLGVNALEEARNDPSSDNFRHFRDGIYEDRAAPILERYSEFNGPHGNSPEGNNNQNFTTQSTQVPDTEDLNENGSLNRNEQYWEYKIRVRPQDLIPGSNFIVDSIRREDFQVGTAGNTVDVTWYQFRIPIAAGKSVNGINNFKSINFMRMYMAGWQEEVIMRMTEFQLVSTQWLRYRESLREGQVALNPPEPPFAEFEVGTLSLEENSQKTPFPYVLAPGVVQQSINGNTQAGFLQNERSLQMRICNLDDGDARAIFKYNQQNRDFRQYDSLRMWVHAEPIEDALVASNFNTEGDAVAFIRLGLDNDFNYYEYEIPLAPSPPGGVSREAVWANEFNFQLEKLSLGKLQRNGETFPVNERYLFDNLNGAGLEEGHKIYIKGTPKLSDIRNIMIGVRNPKDPNAQPICIEVWVNELRLTDFDKSSGWAARASMDLKLADVANVNASFSRRTAGFGPLEQRVSDRPLEESTRYDIAVNFNLHKLTPKKWGLQMPVYATYGEQIIEPEFDPREADVQVENIESASELKQIRDFRRSRSIAMNNWRKLKTGENPKKNFWDIENFDFTYAYNEELATSSVIERRFSTIHRGAINYRYAFKPVSIEPFKNVKENNPLKLINFSPVPSSVSVSVIGNRQFEERRLRPANQFGGLVEPTFTKNFMITRNYNLVWNFTKNLQLNFNAVNNSRVDEVRGYFETADQFERDSIGTLRDNLLSFGRGVDTVFSEVDGVTKRFIRRRENLINMGRTTGYTHNINLTYQLPFAQFKWLDWLSGNVTYAANFTWQQAPEINKNLGATISNTQNIQASGRVNLKGLYSKFGFLKNIQDEYDRKGRQKQQRNPAQREEQRQIPSKPPAVPKDTTRGPDPFRFLKLALNEVLRIGMSLENIDANFTQNSNTVLPGYLPRTDNFGLDFGYQDTFANRTSPLLPPTTGFILGSQKDIRGIAAENGWITRDTTLSNLFLNNKSTQFTARTAIEPFRGFRIELSMNRSQTRNNSSFYRWVTDPTLPEGGSYQEIDPLSTGNFNMSYIFANTAFEKLTERVTRDSITFDAIANSAAFEEFSTNRQIISARRAGLTPNLNALSRQGEVEGGYQNGYLGNNQDVLLPAFLSAYGIIGPQKITLKTFPLIPLPNWSINYNGLTNLPFLKEVFNSITLKHTYRASYSIGSFNNNINAELANGFPANTLVFREDANGQPLENFQTEDNIASVSIREDFSPLIGINMTMKNGVTASIDYKRGRMLNLSVGTMQLSELHNQDLAVMIGYRKDKLDWQFSFMGRDFDLQNSMNAQLRLTMRDTREFNRSIVFDPSNPDEALDPQYTRGTLNWIISPSIDYVVNTRLNLKLFYEQNINRPYTSQSFDTSFASGGVQIRFTLSN
ncbi:MAG: cell surface protein SprA [Bacteroidota bacterium]